MAHPPLLPGQIPCTTLYAALDDLQLESGEVIEDFQQAYVLHGRLNADRSNAILMCAALTATHHRLDFLIGPGKALDTDRWCVIATDPIANGISTSPSNSARQPGMRFPRFVLRDMVQAQHRLLREQLGIEHLHAVVGASMGGMQALQWAVSHPNFMDRIVGLTPMARTHPWAVMVTEAARSCLMADPAWTGEGFNAKPQRGWHAYAALMNALTMKTPQALAAKLSGCGEAHAWFADVVAALHRVDFDAHDYLYQSWAYEAHDVGTTPGHASTAHALRSIRAATLLLAPPVDLFNPPEAARDAAASIPGARFVEIPSIEGHLAASATDPRDAGFLIETIRGYLLA
jgi:homoserine O-acetyltransferase/O-succinyltransferase